MVWYGSDLEATWKTYGMEATWKRPGRLMVWKRPGRLMVWKRPGTKNLVTAILTPSSFRRCSDQYTQHRQRTQSTDAS
eukprot:1157713-Pelagomonas_calceolata.AAC.5